MPAHGLPQGVPSDPVPSPAGAAAGGTDRDDERSRGDETRPADRPDSVLPLGRDSLDDSASVSGVMDHAGRREYSLADAGGISILSGSAAGEVSDGAASAGCHRHDAERGDVPGISLGSRSYASADGDLLPAVYLS